MSPTLVVSHDPQPSFMGNNFVLLLQKKGGDMYQPPLQYKELRGLLDEKTSENLLLQQTINSLRTELQRSNSNG